MSSDDLFYIKMWVKEEASKHSPFLLYLMEKEAGRDVYEKVIHLLDTLEERLEQERKEGLMNFESLAFQYVGMLPYELDPFLTLDYLYEADIKREVVEVLRIWIKK